MWYKIMTLQQAVHSAINSLNVHKELKEVYNKQYFEECIEKLEKFLELLNK